jgi:AcrR family transcriptional regulator
MFNTATPTEKGVETRDAILEAALELFREKGFDPTTMREIAVRAGVALGAAYYYFPSKEAIIQAYYEVVQARHLTAVTAAFDSRKLDLKGRLQAVMQSKLDIVEKDRKLLGVVFRYSGEPDHPLSCLGPGTERSRLDSIEVFRRAIEPEKMPPDLQQLLPIALFALQMGVLILFIYDKSTRQQRTRRLVDGSLALTVRLLTLAKNPLLRPIRSRVLNLLKEAELLPEVKTQFAEEKS